MPIVASGYALCAGNRVNTVALRVWCIRQMLFTTCGNAVKARGICHRIARIVRRKQITPLYILCIQRGMRVSICPEILTVPCRMSCCG